MAQHHAAQQLLNARFKVLATVGVAWERTVISKQTLFPVFPATNSSSSSSSSQEASQAGGRAHRGAPPLRVPSSSSPSSLASASNLGNATTATTTTQQAIQSGRRSKDVLPLEGSSASGGTEVSASALSTFSRFSEHTLRATKGVNMHPFPVIRLYHADGTSYTNTEEVKLSLVNAAELSDPVPASCPCKGKPILKESRATHLVEKKGEMSTFSSIEGGALELSRLQIGCCTGARGHGAPFRIKAEFPNSNSPFSGFVAYSPPIEVGAKGPFAKVFQQQQQRELLSQAIEQLHQVAPQGVTPARAIESGAFPRKLDKRAAAAMAALSGIAVTVASDDQTTTDNSIAAEQHRRQLEALFAQVAPAMGAVADACSYDGAAEMVQLVGGLGLHKYLYLFLEHEIDPTSFSMLTDDALAQMGVTKMGPRLRILSKIRELKRGQTTSADSSASSTSDLSLALPGLELNLGTSEKSLMSSLPSSGLKRVKVEDTDQSSPASSPAMSSDDVHVASVSNSHEQPESKRRRFTRTSLSSDPVATASSRTVSSAAAAPLSMEEGGPTVHVYLSHVFALATAGKSSIHKEILVVKSLRSSEETSRIVQQDIQRKLLKRAQKHMRADQDEEFDLTRPAQLLLSMIPAANNASSSWMAFTSPGHSWKCEVGDTLKIDNQHSCDVELVVRTFLIPSAPSPLPYIEDFRSPMVFPRMFPGSSLELDLLTSVKNCEPSHAFARVADCLTRGSVSLSDQAGSGASLLRLSLPEDETNARPLPSVWRDLDGLHPFCITRHGSVAGVLAPVSIASRCAAAAIELSTNDSCVFAFKRAERPSTAFSNVRATLLARNHIPSSRATSIPVKVQRSESMEDVFPSADSVPPQPSGASSELPRQFNVIDNFESSSYQPSASVPDGYSSPVQPLSPSSEYDVDFGSLADSGEFMNPLGDPDGLQIGLKPEEFDQSERLDFTAALMDGPSRGESLGNGFPIRFDDVLADADLATFFESY